MHIQWRVRTQATLQDFEVGEDGCRSAFGSPCIEQQADRRQSGAHGFGPIHGGDGLHLNLILAAIGHHIEERRGGIFLLGTGTVRAISIRLIECGGAEPDGILGVTRKQKKTRAYQEMFGSIHHTDDRVLGSAPDQHAVQCFPGFIETALGHGEIQLIDPGVGDATGIQVTRGPVQVGFGLVHLQQAQ